MVERAHRDPRPRRSPPRDQEDRRREAVADDDAGRGHAAPRAWRRRRPTPGPRGPGRVVQPGLAPIRSPIMADAIRVLVSGAAGRMGEAVCEAVEGAEYMEWAGRAVLALDANVSDFLDGGDVMVEFATPESSPVNVMEA